MVSAVAARPRAAMRRAGGWRLSSALLIALSIAIASLFGVFDGTGWWSLGVLFAAIVFYTGATLRTLGTPRALVPFVEAAVLLLVLTVAFARDSGTFGIIPTPDTFGRFGDLVTKALASANEQSVPANVNLPLVFLLVTGVGVAAVAMDTLAITLRMPAVSGIVLLGILVVPGLLLAGGLSLLWIAAAGAAYLFVLWTAMLVRHPVGALRAQAVATGAISIVIALVVSSTAPGFFGGVSGGSGPSLALGYGISPIIDLSKNLHRPNSIEILKYDTTSDAGQYLSLVSLDQFTHNTWTHESGGIRTLYAHGKLGPVPGLSDDVKSLEVRTDIQAGNVRSPWLPAGYPARSVAGLDDEWTWDAHDLSIGSRSASAVDRSYSVTSLVLEPTAEQLKQASRDFPVSVRNDLELPRDTMPQIITDTAFTVAAGSPTDYDRAVALQDFFRNGAFTYSVTAPVAGGYDGDGLGVIAAFLKKKAGYCIHFASAMAVMARILGIPSRVTMGYLPGTATGANVDGRRVYSVTSDELHAWPELYFGGIGWVRFEPTVSLGSVPGYTVQSSSVLPVPATAPTPTSAAAPESAAPLDQQAGSPNASGTTTTSARGLNLGEGLLLLLVLLAAPAVARLLRRQARLRRLRDADAGAAVAWQELTDSMLDLGWSVPVTETPRTFAERLISSPAVSVPAVSRLLIGLERARYGPAGSASLESDLVDDLQAVLAAQRKNAALAARARAFFFPISLVPGQWGARRSLGWGA